MADEAKTEEGEGRASAQPDGSAELGMMTFIVPGEAPMSLEELKAHNAKQAQRAAAAQASADRSAAFHLQDDAERRAKLAQESREDVEGE